MSAGLPAIDKSGLAGRPRPKPKPGFCPRLLVFFNDLLFIYLLATLKTGNRRKGFCLFLNQSFLIAFNRMAFIKRVTTITALAILFLVVPSVKAEVLILESPNTANGSFSYSSYLIQQLNNYNFSTSSNITGVSWFIKSTLNPTSPAKCYLWSNNINPTSSTTMGTLLASTTLTVGNYGGTLGFIRCPFATTSIVGKSNLAVSLEIINPGSLVVGWGPKATSTYGVAYQGYGSVWNYLWTIRVYSDGVNPAGTCTSWTYSDWTICSASSTQSRTVASSSPPGCTGGTPVTSQSCTYSPPIVYATSTYNIDTDMQKIGTTLQSFVVRLYSDYWPFILAFSVVAGFSFAIGRLFKKLG